LHPLKVSDQTPLVRVAFSTAHASCLDQTLPQTCQRPVFAPLRQIPITAYRKFGLFFLCHTKLILKAIWLCNGMPERTLFWDRPAMSRPHMIPEFMFRSVPTVALTAVDSSHLWLCHLSLPPKLSPAKRAQGLVHPAHAPALARARRSRLLLSLEIGD
jgi:hypothetical protein